MAAGKRVVIGMDPHKRSVTIEVMTADEEVLGGGRFGTDADGFAAMIEYVSRRPERVWAIEGCNGVGRHVAMRLLAQSQHVVGVPPRLSARARVFPTGQGRKTDATDAHSVALVGTRMTGLRPVVADEQRAVLRMLADRRRSLGEEHTRKVSQLHALLLELLPVGAKRISPQPKHGHCSHASDPATPWARPVAGSLPSWSVISSRSTPGRRQPTKSSRPCSPRPVPGCWTCTASDRPVPPGCWSRSARSPGSPTATTSPPGPAPPRSMPPPATTSGTASPVREPADQPGAAHHGGRPAPQRHRRPGLLPTEEGQREVLQRSDALPETTTLRRGLPHPAQRPHPDQHSSERDGPGRATR